MKTLLTSAALTLGLSSFAMAQDVVDPFDGGVFTMAQDVVDPFDGGVFTIETIDQAPIEFLGSVEYSIENETFEFEAGLAYYLTPDFTVAAVVGAMPEGGDTTFSGLDLGAYYTLDENATVYVVGEFDPDFEYEDVVVGLSLNF